MSKGLEAVAAFFDIPAETLPNVPKLTVTGSSAISIENHSGLRTFSDDLMEINCGKQVFRIRGSGFVLKKISKDELKIQGKLLYAELD